MSTELVEVEARLKDLISSKFQRMEKLVSDSTDRMTGKTKKLKNDLTKL